MKEKNLKVNKKKIFVYGSFNVLHAGHLRLLKFAKDLGGELIVGILSEKIRSVKVQVKDEMRIESLNQLGWIDKIILVNDIKTTIKKLKPDFIVKGKEFENKNNYEFNLIKKHGGRLLFSSGNSYLDIKDFENHKSLDISLSVNKSFMQRHSISINEIKNSINYFSNLKVCVIGDVILDEYIHCSPLGMSQEEPMVVFSPLDSNKYIGGASIVAAHCSKLGAKVTMYSITGNDKPMEFLKGELKSLDVKTQFIIDELGKTVVKQRYKNNNKTIFKLSHISNQTISKKMQMDLFKIIKKDISKFDCIIFSDFNYGVLDEELIKKIISLGKKYKILMSADSQTSSQVGNINKFKNVDLITPTEREARLGMMNENGGLVEIANNCISKLKINNVILKLGENGILTHKKPSSKFIFTDKLKPFIISGAIDTAGAGDSLLSGASLMLASGSNIWQASFFGTLLSSIQVSREGNIPISKDEVLNVLD